MDSLNKDTVGQEQEIDLIELAKKLWNKRLFIMKICFIGFIIGLVVAFSIPKEYKSVIRFAPDGSSQNGMGALATLAGINLGGNSTGLSLDLYPDVVQSTPFLMELLEVEVTDKEREIDTDLYAYLNEYQKNSWWSYIFKFPGIVKSWFFSSGEIFNEEENAEEGANIPLRLTKTDVAILGNLNKRITIYKDRKSGVFMITVVMQSPEIAAIVVNKTMDHLHKYIIDYRTQKARQDLSFTYELYEKSQMDYYIAQQNYAKYMDQNMHIVSAKYRTNQDRLLNEMNLSYGVYNQMAQQLQLAKVKVQDTAPALTIIQPAVIPLYNDSPRKMLIIVVFLFLGFVGAFAWIYLKGTFYESNK